MCHVSEKYIVHPEIQYPETQNPPFQKEDLLRFLPFSKSKIIYLFLYLLRIPFYSILIHFPVKQGPGHVKNLSGSGDVPIVL